MARRIEYHIRVCDLYHRDQSPHRKDRSTQTSLIKVHSDISDSLAEGSMAALVLLDLSAAFDAVDHSIDPLVTLLHICIVNICLI